MDSVLIENNTYLHYVVLVCTYLVTLVIIKKIKLPDFGRAEQQH